MTDGLNDWHWLIEWLWLITDFDSFRPLYARCVSLIDSASFQVKPKHTVFLNMKHYNTMLRHNIYYALDSAPTDWMPAAITVHGIMTMITVTDKTDWWLTDRWTAGLNDTDKLTNWSTDWGDWLLIDWLTTITRWLTRLCTLYSSVLTVHPSTEFH